jgi:hypothetical protein
VVAFMAIKDKKTVDSFGTAAGMVIEVLNPL